MSMDTDFERVRRALLRQGEGDRVPLFELSIHKEIKAQLLGRPVRTAQDEVDFWRSAGYDFVPVRAGVRSIVRGLNPAVKEWLLQRDGSAAGLATGWVSEHSSLIRTRQDFEAIPWPPAKELGGDDGVTPLDTFLQGYSACLPAEMKLIVQLGYVFMGVWQLMGFENFAYQLADDPEFVQALVNRLGASQMEGLEILLQFNCIGAIWMPDDLAYNSGPMVSPRLLQKYIYPWYRRMVARCRQAGIPVGLHSDGDLTRLLPDLVACGFDGLHPIEPPVNDIFAIKQKWGGSISLAGNIDLKHTLCAGTPRTVAAEVRQKAARLAPGGGWLVGSSNSIPDFVPIENYKALLEASLAYGSYQKNNNRRSNNELNDIS
jgi:uroporphyrinogen decarboxylase